MAKAKILSKEEIKRAMRMADEGSNGLRDKTALALSIMAGMRIGEICALTIGDVRGLDGKAVSIIHLTKHQTKGSRSRRVFVSDNLRKLLNAYLASINDLSDDTAFIRSKRTRGGISAMSRSARGSRRSIERRGLIRAVIRGGERWLLAVTRWGSGCARFSNCSVTLIWQPLHYTLMCRTISLRARST